MLGARAGRHRARHSGADPHLQASASTATPSCKRRIADRKVAIGKRHDQVWAKWQEEARKDWDASPITFSRLALEVWDVIKDEDWVLTANDLKHQVRKLWDFDKPYRHPGVELGTSTQIGISLGVALAHRDKKRIVVDIQPDGDLMFDAGALWIAAKYQIPMLVVMHNNRAYYNDWAHQIRMAQLRGTDEAKAHIGMDLFGPEPDFARAGALHGLLRRRADRQAAGRPAGAAARARRGEEGPARAGRHHHAAPVTRSCPCRPGPRLALACELIPHRKRRALAWPGHECGMRWRAAIRSAPPSRVPGERSETRDPGATRYPRSSPIFLITGSAGSEDRNFTSAAAACRSFALDGVAVA